MWKIPADGAIDQSAISKVFSEITAQQSKYSTRAMRSDFLHRYDRIAKIPKYILRHAYRTLISDASAASCTAEAKLDERVAAAILEVNDPEIILDLRHSNGQVDGSHFDPFWNELQSYLHEISLAADERRHGDVLHMPFVTSLRHLRELIHDRLKVKHPENCTPVPCLEWIRLQFWPSNQYTMRALESFKLNLPYKFASFTKATRIPIM